MMEFQTPFQHVFRPGDAGKRPLLLLHGTGGNEHDLLGLAESVAPGRAVISPRGRILENGMPRFFRRFAEGRFDEDDVRLRASELADFVAGASKAHGVMAPITLGFSNGANIAAALLVNHPGVLAGAVLLRAMAPFKSMPKAALGNKPVLLLSGSADTMIPQVDSDRLALWLSQNGAKLVHKTWPAGHGLVQQDIDAMTAFLSEQD
jgi:phospholipase/carboxylesterase